MKIFKVTLTMIMLTGFLLSFNTSSGKVLNAGSLSSLNNQLYEEVSNVMHLPAYITFQGKDLKGEVAIKMTVKKNGKIDIIEIEGNNRHLNSLISKKIKTLNLWTDTKYSGNIFTYEIQMI